MNDLAFITTLHTDFFNFRRMMELYWTTPDTIDAARFAKTEAAEVLKTNGLWEAFIAFAASRQAQIAAADALDAALRRNISYSRNTVRNMDERNELGDLAMMLLTASGSQPITQEEFENAARQASHIDKDFPLDRIAHMVSSVHMAAYLWQDQTYVRRYAITTLLLIARYPGMDLPQILHARMERIYRKHHPDAGNSYPRIAHAGEAYQNETPAYYLTDDFTGYHPD